MVSKSVAIVEDDLAYRGILTQYLTLQGYNCETFDNPLGLTRKLKEKTFDLIITDIMMPDVSGIDLLAWLKQYHPGIRKMVLSGYVDDSIREIAYAQDVAQVLEKPVPLKELERSIRLLFQEGLSGYLTHLEFQDCFQVMGMEAHARYFRVENKTDRFHFALQGGNLVALERYTPAGDLVSQGADALSAFVRLRAGCFSEEAYLFFEKQDFVYPLSSLLLQMAKNEDDGAHAQKKVQFVYTEGEYPLKQLFVQMLVNMGFAITDQLPQADLKVSFGAETGAASTGDIPVWVIDGPETVKMWKERIEKRITSGFSGAFSRISMLQLVQLVSLAKMTTTLEVSNIVERASGQLYFLKGQLMEACFKASDGSVMWGEKALSELLNTRMGVFKQAPYQEPHSKNFEARCLSRLLMEYVRPMPFEQTSVQKIDGLMVS